ncbi:MAG: TIGR04053 family radical SAM/SPASM domain-containing protein [Saccharolobus sp.]
MSFSEKPHLVFWELTKACPLACLHCRANAIEKPLPNELSTEESKRLLEDIARFGRIVIVFTGGDPLSRSDIFELISYAKSLGLITSIAPAPSKRLNEDTIKEIKKSGVSHMSISLDGANKETHNKLRGYNSYEYAINGIKLGIKEGLNVQVNTVVWKGSYPELPKMVKLLLDLGVKIWEVFFLIYTGRAVKELDIPLDKYKNVIEFLVEAERYGLNIRTVEAPFFRRAKLEGVRGNNELIIKLREILGEPKENGNNNKKIIPTRDGDGIIFISYDGNVYPSGFLPIPLGNVREKSIVEIYRESELLKKIRASEFKGKCGICSYKNICGGSRARAYTFYQDPLAEDPACPY